MTSKQVRDCEDSKVEPRSRSRCPEVHGASMSQRDTTALSSAFVKGPFEDLAVAFACIRARLSAKRFKAISRCTRRPRRRVPIKPVFGLMGWRCPRHVLEARLRGSRRGRRPVCPAERSSASGIIAHTSSLFSDQRDAGSFSNLRAESFQECQSPQHWAHLSTILCLLRLLPIICNPMTIP